MCSCEFQNLGAEALGSWLHLAHRWDTFYVLTIAGFFHLSGFQTTWTEGPGQLHLAESMQLIQELNSQGLKWALINQWLHTNCFFPPSDYSKHFQNQTISFQIRIWETNPGISWEMKPVHKPYFVNNIILLPHADNFWEETQHDAEAAWAALRSTIN